MRVLILILILLVASCSSKRVMKKCEPINSNVGYLYECEEL